MKRPVLFLLICFLCACCACARAATEGDYTYDVQQDGTVRITGYTGRAAELAIPQTLGGRTVTAIGDAAFSGGGFVRVTLPDSLKTLGSGAFRGCSQLTRVVFPSSVERFGAEAFADCNHLSEAIQMERGHSGWHFLPRDSRFSGTRALLVLVRQDGTAWVQGYMGTETELTIPAAVGGYAVAGIAESAFSGYGITRAVLTEGLTAIEYRAFSGCAALADITLPDSLTAIAQDAFAGCSALLAAAGPGSYAEQYCRANGIAIAVPLSFSYALLPDGTAEITGLSGASAELIIPRSIDGYAVARIGGSAFAGRGDIERLLIPSSVLEIGAYAFADCSGLVSVTIENGVQRIGQNAFNACVQLTEITVPPSVHEIDDWAFSFCGKLASVTLQNGLARIGESAFCFCGALKEITVPVTVSEIGSGAFSFCEQLGAVQLLNPAVRLGENVFPAHLNLAN